MYEIYKWDSNNNPYEVGKDRLEFIDVYGYNGQFNKEDIKSLWEDHNILYLCGGVMAVWVEKRNNMNPLIHLISEDDGQIFWLRENDKAFDSAWLDNYIQTLTEVKNRLNK
jgi:hypothetical protein